MNTNRFKKITKRDFASAFKTSAPIMVTFLILGAGFGILMEQHGYGPLWSFFSSIIIFSGTVQFVSVSMLNSGSFVMAALIAFMVAARHIFFSISMIGRYKKEGRKKWYLYYALCDETYAMLSRDEIPLNVNISNYRLLVTLFDQASWIIGAVLGGCMGALLNFDSTGIDFSMTALFITVYIEQWLNSKCHIPAVLGVLATLLCRLIFGRELFLIPAMIIIIAVLTIMREKIDKEMGDEDNEQSCNNSNDYNGNCHPCN